MEDAKQASTVRPPTTQTQLKEATTEAAEKVKAMSNRVEDAFYGDDDSIATMKEGDETSIASSIAASAYLSKRGTNDQPLTRVNANISQHDDRSVASSVAWETMLSKQNQTDARLEKLDTTLDRILQFIQSDKTSNPTPSTNQTETGSQQQMNAESSGQDA